MAFETNPKGASSTNNSVYSQTQAAGTNSLIEDLADLDNLNNISSAYNGLLQREGITDAEKRAKRIEYFYDKILLDVLKLGSEHSVIRKYAEKKTVPNGHEKVLIRRWGGLTAHTQPLKELQIPKSDRTYVESYTGVFASYGRYMAFSDRVEWQLVDPIIAHYTGQYALIANETAERLAREELISMACKAFPNAVNNEGEMTLTSNIGIADYREMALRLKRWLVKPLNNKFRIICSPEHKYDLINDPLVQAYMELTHTGKPYLDGEPIELFDLSFEETMRDDFEFGYELANPGEWYDDNGDIKCRIFALTKNANAAIYANAGADYLAKVTDGYLTDGSAIPLMHKWFLNESDLTAIQALGGTAKLQTSTPIDLAATKSFGANEVKANAVFEYGVFTINDAGKTVEVKGKVTIKSTGEATTLPTDGSDVEMTLANFLKLFTDAAEPTTADIVWYQLPIHKSIMFGKEFLVEIGIDGRTGAKMYVKPKGSAGTLDPIDQRQSIGFKIDTLGYMMIRPEAAWIFYFVPSQATKTYTAITPIASFGPALNIKY